MNMIFDSHAHYLDSAFDEDRDTLLPSLHENGVIHIIECGCTYQYSKDALALCEKQDFMFAACGIHPENCPESERGDLEGIKTLLSHPKCVAVGEIGLDYHYDVSQKDKQLYYFETQLQFAKELDLPVIVHDREAHADTMALLQKYKPKGVLHCYSGSVEMLKEVLKLGMYIGLGGAATFKNARKPLEAAMAVPADRLLLETDCPYMAPVPFRSKRCDSSMIAHTATVIAGVRQTTVQELLAQTTENAKTLFGI